MSNTFYLALVLLGMAIAVQSQPACSAQYQCSAVTTDYNYVACNNGFCQCRSDLGFTGAATPASKCSCNSPNSVIWNAGQPYCVNLQNAVNLANKEAREATLKQQIRNLYQNLIGITPRIIAASGQPLNDIFDINAHGRVTPVGTFSGIVLQQYFYALAAGSFVSAVNFINLKAEGNTVSVRVDINFQPPNQFPRPELNLTQTGFFYFNNDNKVIAMDLSIQNLGFIYDIPAPLQQSLILGLCANWVGNPQTPNVPGRCIGANQQYTDFPSCVGFLSSIPFGSFNRANSNTVTCRLIHDLMVSIPPTAVGANIHCPHVGPTGGGKCVDFPYEYFYTADIANPFP